jgi:amino acid exporter
MLWFAWRLIRRHPSASLDVGAPMPRRSLGGHFLRGLLTDLANPQTVLFFASIFAATLSADTPRWARLLSWLGILGVSVLWRCALSMAFSRRRIRAAYGRCQGTIERIGGVVLAGFGTKLVLDAVGRR